MRKKLVVACFVFLLFLSPSFAYRVSPAVVNLNVDRGKQARAIITLQGNIANEKVMLYLTSIAIDRKGGYNFEKKEDWKYSCLKWVTLYKLTDVKETPEGKKSCKAAHYDGDILILSPAITYIGIEVKVPYATEPGQYYGCLMVQDAEETITKGTVKGKRVAISEITRIGIPITIEVPGRVAKLDGKASEPKVDVKKEEISVSATFQNTGNVMESVKGEARIIGKDGKTYDVVRLKASGSSLEVASVFPECLRDFAGIVTRPLSKGEYKADISFRYGKGRSARTSTSFTVTEDVAGKLKEMLILVAEPDVVKTQVPSGGRSIAGIKISNLDFQPVEVEVIFPNWIEVRPDKFSLEPGSSKSVRVVVSVPTGEEKPERTGQIIFRPKRGKEVVVDVINKEKMEGR